ncbi:molecular chaperone DnaJ [Roseomonas frigidaquae]|uniref:Molecular chaperone DnaJ n=1 Tax=Falsiroseomonas frigidaquae TaxID=487318 RepID=A0ABX1F0E9_9PROT|nr:molecular chaperone DnaJ [Falsiroseomonas frigidaquae]NKE45805.1 molecular chaperone DnaJ [Falsiroseomonas frigidaquae]
MGWLALGLLLLVAILALLKLFAEARPAQVKGALALFAGGFGLVLLVALLATGRAGQAFWALALFGPLVWRWVQARRVAGTFARGGAASPGQASEVETTLLAMTLDHDSGRMTGRVKAGHFGGSDLGELDLPALLALMAELAARDPDGMPLLEAWLDRSHPDWRQAAPPPEAPSGPMGRAEALQVLGLAEGASAEEIRAAHRRLMRSAHPDQGGSDWLASRLNEARDTLLG